VDEAWKRFRQDKAALFGAAVIAVVVAAAALAPWVTPYDPYEQFFDGLTLEGAPLPPNERFWLGTDLLGRDLYTRFVYGARTSLIIGIAANAVAVQSQILNLLVQLKKQFGLSYIFISHDLAVVEHVSDILAGMYLGRIVETAAAEGLFARASHPYTQALISAVPRANPHG
jgi:ABC-type antimicrobial peptide transport system permease subunit